METAIRQYTEKDLAAVTKIWNEVVAEGNAFPQDTPFTPEEARAFFASQTFTGVAESGGRNVGMYMLQPSNEGDCGHIANASYNVTDEKRGTGMGERVVRRWHQGQGRIRFGWMPGHPTLYLRKSVYDRFGLYKTDYRISADYEFMIRILKDGGVRLSYLPEVLIYMSHGGTSTNSLGAYLAGMKEGHRALKENGVRFAWFTDLCRTLRVLAQFVKKK